MQDLLNETRTLIPLPRCPAPDVSIEYLIHLRKLCEAHADKVERCMVSRHEGHPVAFAMPKGGAMSMAFVDLICDWGTDLHAAGHPMLVLSDPGHQTGTSFRFDNEEVGILVYPHYRPPT